MCSSWACVVINSTEQTALLGTRDNLDKICRTFMCDRTFMCCRTFARQFSTDGHLQISVFLVCYCSSMKRLETC